MISDGNDTNSDTSLSSVKQLIRESEVMVYAIGIDGRAENTSWGGGTQTPPTMPPQRQQSLPGIERHVIPLEPVARLRRLAGDVRDRLRDRAQIAHAVVDDGDGSLAHVALAVIA